ncbi:MAG: leucyl/phenylalanyl-tRNA--protein transferase [Planctomycetes bacterium]|nr:leucyl/phenylalanyl-tRNA--protein transferase [Planctomycetota bacterium]
MALEPHELDKLYLPADAELQPLPDDVGLSTPRFLPPPTLSTPEGFVCVGGRLSPDWLLDAYSHGIFPWPMSADEPITWCSPDPRGIIELDNLHVSRRLRRTLRSGKFQATCDRDFKSVIQACATVGDRRYGTWITPAMIEAYCRMHELGHAHSIEVWHENRLVGGAYGVAVGGLFAAESMFYRERDASKIALAHLVAHLRTRGYKLFDVQQWTPHTARMGAIQIPRIEYLRRLASVVDLPVTFGEQLEGQT